jgi:hypothetical protein
MLQYPFGTGSASPGTALPTWHGNCIHNKVEDIMRTRTFKIIGLVALAAGLAAGLGFAQAGRGVGRIGGVVLDAEGNPMEGIKVAIVFSQNDKMKFDQLTSKKGEWSFIGLGTGNWEFTAMATGCMPLTKTLYVSQLGVNPKVTVTMQKIPKGGSGVVADEATFVILEKGNQLFKEAKYDEAIVQYQDFLAKNPNLYQIQVSIGDCYREKGEFEKAIEIYNKVLELAKSDAAPQAGQALRGPGLLQAVNRELAQGRDPGLQRRRDLFFEPGLRRRHQVFRHGRPDQAHVARPLHQAGLRFPQQGRECQGHREIREVPDARARRPARRPCPEHPESHQEVTGAGPGA